MGGYDPIANELWGRLARLVDDLGTDRFERGMFEFVACSTPAAVLFAIEVEDGSGGKVLITEGCDSDLTGEAWRISRDYAGSDFSQDEVFLRQNGRPAGSLEMVVQHPEDRDGEFREKYFDLMSIAEEVSVFNRSDHSTLYLGFCSRTTKFNADQLSLLHAMAPCLASLLRRHSSIAGRGRGTPSELRDRRLEAVRRALLRHEAQLTKREADICARIVIGYRAEAIAYTLGIAPDTVATHRKRAYAKLGISSQTELFGIFFEVVE